MTYCDLDALSRYLDGDMSLPVRREMESHLRGCVSCREELQQLQRVDMILLHFGGASVPVPSAAGQRMAGSVQRRRRLAPLIALSRMMPAAVGSSVAAVLVLLSVNMGILSHNRIGEQGNLVVTPMLQHFAKQSTPLIKARRMSAMLGGQSPVEAQLPPRSRFQFDFN